jgi:asparagine synthase (glutamine-hydrolysing)
MCGLTVWKNYDYEKIKKLTHRGPDADGSSLSNGIHFQHFRLSIQDLTQNGHQPYEKEGKTLVYNGEIYNCDYLKNHFLSDLILVSKSDTEVLFHLLVRYGVAIIKEIDGIYAFVFHDGDRIFAARDPFGVKPLFYNFISNEKYIFSSEASVIQSAVSSSIDTDRIAEFVRFKYVGGENTAYSGIKKVLPGHVVEISRDGVSVFNLVDVKSWVSSENNDLTPIENQLINALESQLVGDVHVGMQLSGGVDSSLMRKYIPQDIENYSSVFAGNYNWDEAEYIDFVSKETKTITNYVEYDEQYFSRFFESMIRSSGGINHPHTMAIIQLAQFASKSVKVLLSGEGADELFMGYDRYKHVSNDKDIINNAQFYSNLEMEKLGFSKLQIERSNSPRRDLIDKYTDRTIFEKLQIMELDFHLENLLHRHDYSTMRHSIEGRVPFLSLPLARYALGLDKRLLDNKKDTKIPLKELCAKTFGRKFSYRTKIGYRVPFNEWIHHDFLSKQFEFALSSPLVKETFSKKILQQAREREDHFGSLDFFSKFVWTTLNLSYL